MTHLTGRLGSLRAKDIMTKRVIVLTPSETITQAILTLKEQRITGAPVVDDAGKLVGIVSISDLLQPTAPSRAHAAHSDGEVAWDLLERGLPASNDPTDQPVQTRMSRKVSVVKEESSLVDVVRLMCRGHWHRVPVVDENYQLCGIISTMDILAAILNVEQE